MVLFMLSPEFPFLLHTMPLNDFCTLFKTVQMCGLVLQIPPSDLYRTKENTIIMRKAFFMTLWNKYDSPLFGENNYKLSKVVAFSYLVSHLHKNWDSNRKNKKALSECGKNTTDVETVESLQMYGKVFYYRSECFLILKLCKTENIYY